MIFLGGLSQISVDHMDPLGRSVSPVMSQAELVACPGPGNHSRLPDYPLGEQH